MNLLSRSGCFLLLVLLFFPGYGATPQVIYGEDYSPLNLGPFVEYLEDPSQYYTIKRAISAQENGHFRENPHSDIGFGFVDSTYWFHVSLSNIDDKVAQWIVESNYTLVDFIDVYIVREDGSIEPYILGDSVPFSQRSIPYHNINFEINADPYERIELYISARTSGTLDLPLTLHNKKDFYDQAINVGTVFGIYFGLLVAMLLYNVFLHISVGDRCYLYYAFYIATFVGLLASFNGFSFRYLWPDLPAWNSQSPVFFLSIYLIGMLLFVRAFLPIKEYYPHIDFILKLLLSGLFAIMVGVLFLPYSIVARALSFMCALSIIAAFVSGILCWLKGYQPARYYLLSWVACFLGVGVHVMKSWDLLPANLWTSYAPHVGATIELMLLSFAMSDRIRSQQETSSNAHLRKQYYLESEVDKRTSLLQQATKDAEYAKDEALKSQQLAEDALRAKSEFLATMSHEIRTPLSGVLGIAQLLRKTPLDSVQMEYVSTINTSGNALLSIINDVLDYSKIEAGKMELDHQEFNLVDVFNECVSMFSMSSRKSDVNLFISLDPEMPVDFRGDPARIKQILINYLSNAFKFTERGAITLKASLLEEESQKEDILIRFSVRDTGIGLTDEQANCLFEEFQQVDTNVARRFKGTGLGLAICKRLASAMQGAVGVDSEEGKGSTFWFTARLHRVLISNSMQAQQRRMLGGRHILIMGHSEVFNRHVEQMALRWGMKVTSVCSGAKATELLSDNSIDVILSDQQLADEETISWLKRQTKTDRIICLSVNQRNGEYVQLVDEHVVASLVEKPVHPGYLFDTLTRLLGIHKQPNHDEESSISDRVKHLRVLVAEDNPVNQMVIKGVLKCYDIDPEMVENGELALNAANDGLFDLVLMDCEMPVMGGFEAVERIRRYEQENNLPAKVIVGLSAHALEEFESKGVSAGMDKYLTKPLKTRDLESLLLSLVNSDP